VLALTGAEWALLVVAIGPAVLAVVVVVLVWRWAKRSEEDSGQGS
jgi:membrane protein implicated in regulation of membrane protease activity